MKTTIRKETLLTPLQSALRLTVGLRTQSETLGIFLSIDKEHISVAGISETKYFLEKIPHGDNDFTGSTAFCLDTKKFVEFIQNIPGDHVQLSVVSSSMRVSSDRVRASFPITPIQQLPDVFGGQIGTVSIDPRIIIDALPNLLFCVASDSARPTLSSIKFIPQSEGKLMMVSTDGFRLSLVQTSFPSPLEKPLQVPAVFLRDVFQSIVQRDKPVELVFYQDDRLGISQGGVFVGARLVAGDFPPYERVLLKTHQHNVFINRGELAQAVKTMAIFARDFSNILVFEFREKDILIRPKKESGQDNSAEISMEFQGVSPHELRVAFNHKYILEFLSSVEDDHITLRLNRADSPVLFLTGKVDIADSHEGVAYQHIIMPVRIQE